MRTYRGWWTAAVAAVTGTAVVVGSAVTSPWVFVAEGIVIGLLAGVFGGLWEEDPRSRWRTARAWAARGAVAAIVLTALPAVIGAWTLLVLLALGVLAPDVVLVVRRKASGRHDQATSPPWGLSDDELTRRWKYTSTAVRSTWRTPEELLLLVQEREQLLDELERRDPDGFALWLVSSGWRQVQDR